jgi:hypothetical protein
MTPSGTEPATYRLATQCFNQLRHQQHARKSRHVFLEIMTKKRFVNWRSLAGVV